MFQLLQTRPLAERVHEIWVEAPHVAAHGKAGQFVILRIDDQGERIPLTISAVEGNAIRCIFMAVGKTTHSLAALRGGDTIRDVAGPLGRPSDIRRYGTVAVIGGGVGIASAPIIAQAAREAGNYVIGIIGARNGDMLILEEEMAGSCNELHIATDDGSKGIHGFPSDILKKILLARKIDCCWIIGPAIMMKVTSAVTRPYDVPTFVSLNPIMVDGTGMCGSCRVSVGGKTRFACVDGPEFDAHKVDFELMMRRQQGYLVEERDSLERYHRQCGCNEGSR